MSKSLKKKTAKRNPVSAEGIMNCPVPFAWQFKDCLLAVLVIEKSPLDNVVCR